MGNHNTLLKVRQMENLKKESKEAYQEKEEEGQELQQKIDELVEFLGGGSGVMNNE